MIEVINMSASTKRMFFLVFLLCTGLFAFYMLYYLIMELAGKEITPFDKLFEK